MKTYSYTAYSDNGQQRNGVILAETESHAVKLLQAQGLFASEVLAKPERGAAKSRRHRRSRLNADMQAVFTRQMAVLLSAELSSETALDVVRGSGTTSALESFATRAKAALLNGQPLSEALEAGQGGFARYYIAAVRAGETSGEVASVFNALADHLETTGADRSQIATALIYPAFVAAVSLLVCAILMVNVAPEIVSMFEISGQELPQITRIVLAVSDWIQAWFVVLLLVLAFGIVGFNAALRTVRFRDLWDRFLLRLPIVGRLIRLGAAAQYLRTLSLVISSRQAVLDAAKSAGEVLMIERFRTESDATCEAIRSGESLSEALKRLSIIPPIALQLVSAGERSARLARMTERGAVMVEGWLQNERKRIAALLDPILMMIVGAFVMIIVLAVLLPIFDLQAIVAQ